MSDFEGNQEVQIESSPAADTWTTYSLDWLYDPDRFDHLPLDQQLALYKQRDLRKAKIFKLASTIWDSTYVRKRRFVAKSLNPLPVIASNVKSNGNDNVNKAGVESESNTLDPEVEYAQWVSERRKLREGLESLSVNELWLASKHSRTPMEERVLQYLRQRRKMKESGTAVAVDDKNLQAVLPTQAVCIQRPSPEALRILEKYLRERQIRLIDLFRCTDKNKDGRVSKDDFRGIVRESEIPLPDGLLDDLVMSLNYDSDGRIDFKQLVRSMEFWLAEKKDAKRKILALDAEKPDMNPELEGFEFSESLLNSDSSLTVSRKAANAKNKPSKSSLANAQKNNRNLPSVIEEERGLASEDRRHSNAGSRHTRSVSSRSLTPPCPDLRSEQMILSSDEAMVDLRKRNKAALVNFNKKGKTASFKFGPDGRYIEKKTMISTGDVTVDSHMAPSTLTGDVGDRVDHFRQECYREYLAVCRLCEQHGIMLTNPLLKRALLYPADKSAELIIASLKKKPMSLSLIHSSSLTAASRRTTSSRLSHHGTTSPGSSQSPGRGQQHSRAGGSSRSKSRSRRTMLPATRAGSTVSGHGKAPSLVRKRRTKLTTVPELHSSPAHMLALRDMWSSGDESETEETNENAGAAQRRTDSSGTVADEKGPKEGVNNVEDDDDDEISYHRPRPEDVGIDAYTRQSLVKAKGEKMDLPTGRAVVKRQVDCWMTFEEYRDLIKPMPRRYTTLTTKSNPYACWPGRALDKVRMYLDNVSEAKSNALFQHTAQTTKRSNPSYNNDLRTWPVSADGYVQYANIDSNRLKYI